ncbi:MAG: hypothetical protein LBG91_00810 [Treponema sp.]|jgi:WD40 repeat protein|nr:hypothetical protein [Treponema sp.]
MNNTVWSGVAVRTAAGAVAAKAVMAKAVAAKAAIFAAVVLSAMPAYAVNVAGGHRGTVTALIHNGDRIISAGEDGFIGIWSVSDRTAQDRFQLTTYSITSMVKHPLREEICIVESSRLDRYRISVWNYRRKEKLFSLQSGEEITFAGYSAGGSFIIAAGLNNRTVTTLNSVSGKIVSPPSETPPEETTAGKTVFAATGRAERNMLVYQSSGYEGFLSYLELESAAVTGRFEAPGGFANPVIFGNNRFLAGTNREGLLLVDAASGTVLDKIDHINRNALLCSGDNEFFCINTERSGLVLYNFSADQNGRLVRRRQFTLDTDAQISSIAYNGSVVLGTTKGEIFLIGQQGEMISMAADNRPRVIDIAAGKNTIAFLTENGEVCFLPLNYSFLEDTKKLIPAEKSGYTRISPLSETDGEQFILWQTDNTRILPVLINEHQTAASGFGFLPGRFPLRSVSARNNKGLFLDAAGNLSMYDLRESKKNSFTFSSIGAIDMSFTDSENIIICRSVISGNSPFIVVNSNTGETLPLAYPSKAGVMVYTGDSGNIYTAAVEEEDGEIKTIVSVLPAVLPAGRNRILEYSGEESQISAAESAGAFAAVNGEEAAIYGEKNIFFERTEGLPVKILGCPAFFLSLDSEGGIAWHDNRNGKLLAVFRLYADRWTLTGGREISGVFSRP